MQALSEGEDFMPFEKGNAFGKVSKRTKTFAERYRLTPEEKVQAREELLNDISLPVKQARTTFSLSHVADVEQRFGQMGHHATGFRSLDKLTLGFDRGEYIVIGAGTNAGKTQLATYIAKQQAESGVTTLYVSRELSNTEMRSRFSYIGMTDFTNLHVPDINRLDIEELLSLIRDFASEHDKAFVIVDHLHAFYRGSDLTEVLGMFSAGLRELAQDLGITIIALSQFNRQPYKDSEGPMNHHLKESGYIADDAYTIMLAWRTVDGFNVKLSKSRRRDMGDLREMHITLASRHGKLTDDSRLNVKPVGLE